MKHIFLIAVLLTTPAAAVDMQAELYGMAQLPRLGSPPILPQLGSPAGVQPANIPSFEKSVVKLGLTARQAPYLRAFLQKWNEFASRGKATVATRHCNADGSICALMLTSYNHDVQDGFENKIVVTGDDFFALWSCKGTFDTHGGKPIGGRVCGNNLSEWGEQSFERMSRDGYYFMLGYGSRQEASGQEGMMRFEAHERALAK